MAAKRKFTVVTGPSGSGIKEIIGSVLDQRADVDTVVPLTARKKKAGEQDGVNFWFYDLEQWNELKESGDLLEAIEFAGNDYGTSRRLVQEKLEAGIHVLLYLEPKRAARVKQNMPEALCVYMTPADPNVLRDRFAQVAHNDFEVRYRMQEAQEQEAQADFCDAKIADDNPAEAAAALSALIG